MQAKIPISDDTLAFCYIENFQDLLSPEEVFLSQNAPKSFVGRALPGPARGAYSAPPQRRRAIEALEARAPLPPDSIATVVNSLQN